MKHSHHSTRGRVLSLAVLAAAGLISAHSEAAAVTPARSVAVYPLKSLGTEQQIVDRLEEILRAEVDRLRGVELQECADFDAAESSPPTPAVLDDAAAEPDAVGDVGEATACVDDPACLSRLGRGCGVDSVVYGTVGTLGESYVLDLKLVGARARRASGRQTVSLSGDKVVLIDGVRFAVTNLVAPEQYLGALELRLDRAGAVVYLDEVKVGTTPLGRLGELQPGTHALRIAIPGYQDFERSIDITFARTTVVNIVLTGGVIAATVETTVVETEAEVVAEPVEPTAAPPAPWRTPLLVAGLSVLGGGVVALAVGGVGLGVYSSAEGAMDEHTGAVEHEDERWWIVEDKKAFDDAYDTAFAAWNTFIFGAVIGGVAVVAGTGMSLTAVLASEETEAPATN